MTDFPSLERKDLLELLPHGPSMCLIDKVTSWGREQLHCETNSHTDIDNPLYLDNYLPVSALLEYAAQAAGIHLALSQSMEQEEGAVPEVGYVSAVKNVTFTAENLQASPLRISANNLIRQQGSAIYEVSIETELGLCFQGRINLTQKSG